MAQPASASAPSGCQMRLDRESATGVPTAAQHEPEDLGLDARIVEDGVGRRGAGVELAHRRDRPWRLRPEEVAAEPGDVVAAVVILPKRTPDDMVRSERSVVPPYSVPARPGT